MERLCAQRREMTTFVTEDQTHTEILFSLKIEETKLTRLIDPAPFVPTDRQNREKRCDEILMIQAMGLKKLSGTYRSQCCGRYFRRTGFDAGTSGDRACL